MIAAWYLARRHAMHYRVRTAILSLCIACAIVLPLATRLLIARYRQDLTSRADATPMVLGARGSKVDLTLLAMYFRASDLPSISMGEYAAVQGEAGGLVIPVHARHTARNVRIVAVTTDYFEARGLLPSTGALPSGLGEAVLGARAARVLGVESGGTLFSDQRELYDLSKPPALKMHVSGVLAPTGTADDDVVFVDLKTAWILEGLSHGHGDAKSLPASMVLDRTKTNIVVSEQLIHYNEVTPRNVGTFHLHAAPEQMPLSALLFFPRSDKEGTILKALINEGRDPRFRGLQAIVPREVVNELLAVVLRLRTLIDAISIVLGGTTLALFSLIIALSTKAREREILTLDRLGCPAPTVRWLVVFECVIVLACGSLVALACLGWLASAAPRLMRVLS